MDKKKLILSMLLTFAIVFFSFFIPLETKGDLFFPSMILPFGIFYLLPQTLFIAWPITILTSYIIVEIFSRLNIHPYAYFVLISLAALAFLFQYEIRSFLPCDSDQSGIQYDCLMNKVSQKGDPEICKDLPNGYPPAECIMTSANRRLDPNLCLSITDEYSKNSCIQMVAVKKKNISICKLISDEIEKCIIEVSKLSKDLNGCNQLEDSYDHDKCVSEVGKIKMNIEICNKVSNEYPSFEGDCITFIAKKKKDSRVCNSIKSSYYKEACISQIAYTLLDIRTCEQINDDFEKQDCISSIAILKNSTELCKKVDNKIMCIAKIAIDSENHAICNELLNESDRKECISEVEFRLFETKAEIIVNTINFSCKSSKNEIIRSKCSLGMAIINKDYIFCLNMSIAKDFCLFMTGTSTMNTSVCRLMDDSMYKSGCLLRIALDNYTTDENVCMEMEGESREYCYLNVQSERCKRLNETCT